MPNPALKRGLIALFLGVLCACADPVTVLSEGPLEASECHYVEASDAAQKADQEYQRAERSRAPKARRDQYEAAQKAAERRQEDAARCEQRAREWSDLRAQWQSAHAAVASAITARNQVFWTIVEIIALIVTIGVGITAIIITKLVADQQIEAIRQEGAAAAARFQEEIGEARAANAAAKEAGQAQVRAYLQIRQAFVSIRDAEGDTAPLFRIIVANSGNSPARHFRWAAEAVVLLDDIRGKLRGSDWLPSESWGRDIAGGDNVELTSHHRSILLSAEDIAALPSGRLHLLVTIHSCFKDVFGSEISAKHNFMAQILGRSETQLSNWPSSAREHVERMELADRVRDEIESKQSNGY